MDTILLYICIRGLWCNIKLFGVNLLAGIKCFYCGFSEVSKKVIRSQLLLFVEFHKQGKFI